MVCFTCNICGAYNDLPLPAWQAAEAKARPERERADVLTERIRLASGSRWLRLGRQLGTGPKFE